MRIMPFAISLALLAACSDGPTDPNSPSTYSGPDLNGFHMYNATMNGRTDKDWHLTGVMVLQHDFASGKVGGFLFWTAEVAGYSLSRDWIIVLGEVVEDGKKLELWSPNDGNWHHEADIAPNTHLVGTWQHTASRTRGEWQTYRPAWANPHLIRDQ